MSHALAPLKPLLSRLHGNGRLRVWSVVVTIFGDVVQPRQQAVSVQELLVLTGALGIAENALRTALSRLAKEGWVERHKQGRRAYYSLSESGRRTFLAASERIYHHSFSSASSDWYLISFDPLLANTEKSSERGLPLSRHWRVINEEDLKDLKDEDVMIFKAEPRRIPDWALNEMLPQNLAQQYQQLNSDLQFLATTPKVVSTLSPLCAMTARVLLIHAWRRLVLRHPLMPQQLLPADWPGVECHKRVSALYPDLVVRAEPWWNELTSEQGLATLQRRFTDRQYLTNNY